MFLENFIKNFVYFFVNFLPRRKGAVILMYHSITDNDVFFTVKSEMFEKQMDYLKNNNYNVIKLSDLVDILESSKEIPKKTVVLTFDDGYQDNYNNAFPILKKYNFSATIFLVISLVEREMNNVQNIPIKVLYWQQIKEMHQSGIIDFQPHGLIHQRLDQISLSQVKFEVGESKRIIEKQLNKTCQFFSYPKGRYNQETIQILKNNGFKVALTIKPGFVRKNDELFTLKRNSINSSTSFVQFKVKIRA